MDRSCIYITHAKERIKHELPLATKQFSQSDISWTHQNISLSRRTCEFWKAHRIIHCTVFWKDCWAFCDFEFSRSQLINIHEKIGTREKSPDNRGPDNRGSTVISELNKEFPAIWLVEGFPCMTFIFTALKVRQYVLQNRATKRATLLRSEFQSDVARIPHSINYEETGTSEGLWDRLGRRKMTNMSFLDVFKAP